MQSNQALEVNCLSPYRMLAGLSFELLFKAHCIGACKPIRAIHSLSELARSANVDVSPAAQEILDVLSGYIFWDGRYPTPKDWKWLETHWKAEAKLLRSATEPVAAELWTDKLSMEVLIQLWRSWSDLYLKRYG
jgi:hypothetical protein